MPDRRIAITGVGVICCLGANASEVWEALRAGRSGIGPITKFDPTGLRNTEAGEVPVGRGCLSPPACLPLAAGSGDPALQPEDDATRFALVAATEAMASAGIDLNTCDPTRVGLVCSTNFGGATSWDAFVSAQAQGESATALLRRFRFDDAGDEIASRLGLQGPKTVISNSCSSGAHAIGHGADLIRLGRADAVLAGGHDALALSALAGLSALRTITAEKCRPFDLNRSGTIFGEGAGMVVLEEMTAARRRGAPILGELLGYAVNNNAYHMTAPDKDGAGLTMALRVALADAGVSPNRIDYISAHGTGTSYHDVAETRAIKAVLGDHAYRLPVSSIKPATGHLMAAAGAVEAITCLWAMRDGIVPPTLNYDTPDPDCDLDYVPNHAREASVRVAVSISSGIGGNNVALVLGKGDA